MRLLIIGQGAREHALVWKLAAEPLVDDIVCAPGNPGMARLARCLPADTRRLDAVLDIVRRESIDLTVVGPEAPLALGLVDRLAAEGRPAFGPSRAAARLEASKVFAKKFMARHDVPTADFVVCDTAAAAIEVVDRGRFGTPLVIKADGLAAGKGVVVAPDAACAREAIRKAMVDRVFGEAGSRVVIEECLVGEEASFFALADGREAVPLMSAQDHKRAFDDDKGPNTGGMGAFAPSRLVPPDVEDRIMRDIVAPTITGMRAEGHPYVGVLFVGLMMTADGPKVIEFNVRFGDPETQVVLPRLDGDLLPLLVAAVEGRLGDARCRIRPDPHVGIVLASAGYPGTVRTGYPIAGLDKADEMDDVLVFHAGTAGQDGRVVTAGGRVLTVVGRGPDFRTAIDRAYAGAAQITFEGKQFRTDIGRRAVA